MKRITLLCLGLLCLAGCGGEKPDDQARDPGEAQPEAVAQRPEPSPEPPPKSPEPSPKQPKAKEPEPPAPPPPSVEDFERQLAAVLALEQMAEFVAALRLCREMKEAFRRLPQARELDPIAARLTEARRAAPQLAYAIERLGTDDLDVVEVARKRLVDAGDLGAILLREAVQEQPEAIADRAAQTLVALRDVRVPDVFVQRLAQSPPAPLRTTLLDGLKALLPKQRLPLLRPLFALVKQDTTFQQRDLAAWFCDLLERPDPPSLARVLDDPEAPAILKAYVEKAFRSGDEALVAWAEVRAAAVGLGAKGLRGQYYDGTNFEKLLHERVDTKIQYNRDTFALPGGRSDNLSVRWTGFLRVPKPGGYTFFCTSDDGKRLWIDDKLLIDDWKTQGATEQKARVNLAAGHHTIKLEYFNGSGDAAIELSWKGPGMREKELLTSDVLSTKPWPGMRRE